MAMQYLFEAIVQHYYPAFITDEAELQTTTNEPNFLELLPQLKTALDVFDSMRRMGSSKKDIKKTYFYQLQYKEGKEIVTIKFNPKDNKTSLCYERLSLTYDKKVWREDIYWLMEYQDYKESIANHFETH